MNKLLIYIVAYERKSYTQGTIECIFKVKPKNSQIIVCDNGSTDGTREWLQENQEKYELGLLFPEENLRVPGAWKLLTNYFSENEFDYILLLDNDNWILPNKTWFNQCLEVFTSDPKICSLGLHKERKPGTLVFGKQFDPNYDYKKPFNTFEMYDTVLYAGARLDQFSIWYKALKNWSHKFIGDKLCNHYRSLGYRTLKITPGFIIDISEYNFDNKEHQDYNQWFFERERDGRVGSEYLYNVSRSLDYKDVKSFTKENFGIEYIKFL
jgi:glycosyltransferase involved in cell wall biosynthesis